MDFHQKETPKKMPKSVSNSTDSSIHSSSGWWIVSFFRWVLGFPWSYLAQDIYFRLLCPLSLAPPELASWTIPAGSTDPLFGHGRRTLLGPSEEEAESHESHGDSMGSFMGIHGQMDPNL